MHVLAKTGEQSYVAYGLWETEEDMQTAMPQMIALLDSSRHLLEELSLQSWGHRPGFWHCRV